MRLLAGVAVLAAMTGASCFGPDIQDGHIECAALDDDCPVGFECRACDHRCWRNPNLPCGGEDGSIDAPDTDAAASDAPIDGPEGADAMPDAFEFPDAMSPPDGPVLPTCMNGICDMGAGEDPCTCPADCGSSSCGDGLCCAATECGCPECVGSPFCPHCPNGTCEPLMGENCTTCSDCPCICGDGFCTGSETRCTCAIDCGPPTCDDGLCCAPGECGFCAECISFPTCTPPVDAGSPTMDGGGCTCTGCSTGHSCSTGCTTCCFVPGICGNGTCDVAESSASCPCDCSATTGDGGTPPPMDGGGSTDMCGNGICEWMLGFESCSSCPTDCTPGPAPPGCVPPVSGGTPGCDIALGENCMNCSSQCGVCTCSGFCDCQHCPSGCPCGACPP